MIALFNLRLHRQTGTVFSQPLLSLQVIGHHLVYFIPEDIGASQLTGTPEVSGNLRGAG